MHGDYNEWMTENTDKNTNQAYNDPNYLSTKQYQTAANLNARIEVHKRFSTAKQPWHDFVFEHLPLSSQCTGLALGCGNASQWQANQVRFPQDLRMFLSEYSYGMLQEPIKVFKDDPRFMLCAMDAMHIAFESNRFDFVTANHMLYHVPDVNQTLSEVVRVLKPEGMLMAATNGERHMADLDDLLHAFDPRFDGEHVMSGVFSLHNGKQSLEKWFDEIEVIPYQSDLQVTDAQLLAEYAFSMPKVKELFEAKQKEALAAFFHERILRDGAIFIAKETGLFIARKPRK